MLNSAKSKSDISYKYSESKYIWEEFLQDHLKLYSLSWLVNRGEVHTQPSYIHG